MPVFAADQPVGGPKVLRVLPTAADARLLVGIGNGTLRLRGIDSAVLFHPWLPAELASEILAAVEVDLLRFHLL